jgi:hypothetical protein
MTYQMITGDTIIVVLIAKPKHVDAASLDSS